MITHLEPDILECEVKWALESITTNKASGDDGIPVELFQVLKDDAVKVLHSVCQQIWKTQQWPQDWKRSVFIPIPKKGNAKECSNYRAIALISHASKVMLKILQARLQQYVNHELPDGQAGFRKGRGTRDQIASIHWIIKKAREFQKDIYFCFIDYSKAFNCVDHNKLWKILKEMGIPEHLTCLLRNLYAGQEATVRTGHGTTDWFQIGKGVRQGYILSLCLFNLYAVHHEYLYESTSNQNRNHYNQHIFAMRNKVVYYYSIKVCALGFNKLLKNIFCLLPVVEAFSLQEVVEMLEVVVSW